jgi:hypothetical protein
LGDLRDALTTGTAVEEMVGSLKFGAGHAPATGFDAGNRDDAFVFGRNEDREIEDAILPGAEEFFAIDENDGESGVVSNGEFGDGTGGVNFGDTD